MLAAEKLNLTEKLHTGIVHCKSSLYAREMGFGPMAEQNNAYITLLKNSGVLASEMESAALFILAHLQDHVLQKQKAHTPTHRVLAGGVLAIITDPQGPFKETKATQQAITNSIEIALEAVRILASQELHF
jgi:uridine phosphorylase